MENKTLRLHGLGDLQLHPEPYPSIGQGDTALRIRAVGICGSDLHWFSQEGIGDARLTAPLVLGHEFAAQIAEGPRQGERVAVDPAVPCRCCEFCETGHPNLCIDMRFAGHGRDDGAMRQFMAWPERCLFPIPDSFSDADGAMLEPLGVAIHTVDLAHLKPGMTVGVFGCGPIGLLILQVARVAGAVDIVATDVLQHRLDAAKSLGAATVIQASEAGSEREEVTAAARGHGVDVAIEAAGTNEAIETAIDAVRPGGTVVLAGIPGDDQTSFTASVARRKGLTIKLVRRMKHVYPRAIRLVELGMVDVRSLVTHEYSLDDYQAAFSTASQRQGLKVIINP
jgi:L-iditol 2-dehydrogenase